MKPEKATQLPTLKPVLTLILGILLLFLFVSCKDKSTKTTPSPKVTEKSKPMPTQEADINTKTPSIMVEATINGMAFALTQIDLKKSTDVVLLDNGIQFRVNDTVNQVVLVNLYAPDFFKNIPISITQQTAALAPEEAFKVKTQSRVEFVIPSEPAVQGDTKVLYEGVVTLSAYSPSKLAITFQGKGLSLGSRKNELFPMQGKIVFENFTVYDNRQNE